MRDAIGNTCRVEPQGYSVVSSSSADIRALRKICRDGPLSVDPGSRNLLIVSMSAAHVENDNGGQFQAYQEVVSNNQARDDVAAAADVGCGCL